MSRGADRTQTARHALDTPAGRRADRLIGLREQGEKQSAAIRQRNTWSLPTSGYRLTGRFGERSGLWSRSHTGLDFAAPSGTPLVSVAAGTVVEAGWAGPYGNRTIVRLEDGTELWFAHQSRIDVTAGQQVGAGQPIGAIGATGNVTGSHVHLEVRPGGGGPVDPERVLLYHGLQP